MITYQLTHRCLCMRFWPKTKLVLSFCRTNLIVYTLERRGEILRHYFEKHGNVLECVRKLHTDFRRRQAPSAPYVCYIVKKAKETGSLIDKPKLEKPKTVRTPDNITAVAESVCEASSSSIHCRP